MDDKEVKRRVKLMLMRHSEGKTGTQNTVNQIVDVVQDEILERVQKKVNCEIIKIKIK